MPATAANDGSGVVFTTRPVRDADRRRNQADHDDPEPG